MANFCLKFVVLIKFPVQLNGRSFLGDKLHLCVRELSADLVGNSLGGIIAGLISWIIIFFITKLLLILVKKFLTVLIKKLPLVGKLNHLLGFVEGVLKALLIISAVLAVVSIIPSTGIGTFFDKTLVVKWLYNHNPINEILSWILV